MERERTGALHSEDPVSGTRSPAELAPLIAEAHAAVGDVRQEAAERINDLLIALRAPGNEAAEAKAILGALDVSQLNGLVDGRGRDCRKEAVETLLACGFPHALAVNPADLEHARRAPSVAAAPGGPTHPLVRLGGVVALFAAVAQLIGAFNLFLQLPPLALLLVVAASLVGMAGIRLSVLKGDESVGRALGLIGSAVFLETSVAYVRYGFVPWTFIGLAALSAALATVGHANGQRDRDGT